MTIIRVNGDTKDYVLQNVMAFISSGLNVTNFFTLMFIYVQVLY